MAQSSRHSEIVCYGVVMSPVAEEDLAEIGDFIAVQSGPRPAALVVEAILDSIMSLDSLPHRFPRIRSRVRLEIRSMLVKGYRVIYAVHDAQRIVDVMSVVYGTREVEPIIKALFKLR